MEFIVMVKTGIYVGFVHRHGRVCAMGFITTVGFV